MNELKQNGTAERRNRVSRDQIPRRDERGIYFPCSADNEQDWQPYRLILILLACGDYVYSYILTFLLCDPGWYVQRT